MQSVIPSDEVIGVMLEVGSAMPSKHRETAQGGLAQTPTGRKIMEDLKKERRGKRTKEAQRADDKQEAEDARD